MFSKNLLKLIYLLELKNLGENVLSHINYYVITFLKKTLFLMLSHIGLLTFAFYWLSGSDFPVFGKLMYFLLNNVSKALILYFIRLIGNYFKTSHFLEVESFNLRKTFYFPGSWKHFGKYLLGKKTLYAIIFWNT